MSIGEFIKARRKEMGLSVDELARKIGKNRATVYRYESSYIEKLPSDVLIPLASALLVTPADLIANGESNGTAPTRKPWEGLKNIVPPEDLEVRKVPLLGTIAAGKPIFSDEHIETMIPCKDSRIDFALQIQGDSMIDAEYYDGDIVFIHSQPMVDNGQIAAVRVDDSATLKRFYKENDSVTLMSANPLYPPMHFDSSNCDEIAIIGIPVARYTEHTK